MNTAPEQILADAWLLCLSRPPTKEESEPFLKLLSEAKPEDKRLVVEDIYWSLLTSREFLFQH